MDESGPDRITTGVLAGLLGAELRGDADVVVSGVSHDSRTVVAGDLFCCVSGANHDGHEFAPTALRAGASAVLGERELAVDRPQLLVSDVRAAMGPASAAVHGDPSSRLAVVGVTGTNGKTTVVSMLGSILAAAGHRVEVIGTLTGARTTPEAPELSARLAELVAQGVTHVAMEVSSHALDQGRVDSVHFAVGVFTNLGSDHLDHHGSIEAYFRAKAKLFEADRCGIAVLNIDDPRGRLLRDASDIEVRPYGLGDAQDLHAGAIPTRFTWHGQPVSLAMPGTHNVLNALAAAEAARALGVGADAIARGLGEVPQVPGRFEIVTAPTPLQGAATVVVDFAHTPDALDAAIDAARGLAGDGELWVVFGCGGDRDRAKRPRMGEVAESGADHVVVTNDNPRSEDPLRIIAEVRAGFEGEPIVEPDRRAAITHALAAAGEHDVVLIAGKGHEQGQVFADHTEEFDDRLVAAEALAALRGPAAGETTEP